MIIKLDISKVYDRVEWDFLRSVFIQFEMDSRFVELIMLCVSSISYSVLLNGSLYGAIRPERGIRQGDPLSPCLYICMAEAFIGLVAQVERNGSIHGVKVARSASTITNICLADDTMLFCKATEDEALVLKEILEIYATVSGQVINLAKSSITFNKNTDQISSDAIKNIIGVQEVINHG